MSPSKTTTTFGTSDTPTKKPLNGYFNNKHWLCNCQPRLPAIQFQVRKESANKGRWFYTCQVDRTKGKAGEPERCDFFLWAEDARIREEAAVLNNSHSEPTGTQQAPRTPKKMVQTTLSATVTPRAEGTRHWTHRTDVTPIADLEKQVNENQKGESSAAAGTARSTATLQELTGSDSNATTPTGTLDHSYGESDLDTDDEHTLDRMVTSASTGKTSAPQPVPHGQIQTPSAALKRKRDDVDDLLGDTDSDEERQLATITDSLSHSQKGSRKVAVYATPAVERSTDVVAGMSTPSLTGKPVRRVLFSEAEPGLDTASKRQRLDETDRVQGPPGTPSSSQEALPSSSTKTPATPATSNITEEVLALLKSQNIEERVLRSIKNTLEKHAAKAMGLERGREAARQAVKKADVRVAQLQERVADLENQRRLDAEARKKIRRV